MKAVIGLLGKQHLVTEGDEITVDRLEKRYGEVVDVDVLAIVDGDKSTVGKPHVDKAKVKASVISHGRGKKIRVLKYKNKINYHVVQGHRQNQSTVKIDKITI